MSPTLKKIAVLAALVVVFILGVSLKNYIFSVSSTVAPACLEYLGSAIEEIDGVTAISGRIKNNCAHRFQSIQVNFTLVPHAKAVAYGHDLQPGKSWDFRTLPVPKDSVYRFTDISAY